MRHKGIIAALVLLAILGVFLFGQNLILNKNSPLIVTSPAAENKTSPPSESEERYQPFTARFAIFTQGTKRIFTDQKYHNRSQDAYIESSDPTQIIVIKPQTTWQAFFDSLPAPMKITKDCLTTGTGQQFCTNSTNSLTFYLNGKKDPDVLSKVINTDDTLLISYGSQTKNEITAQLQSVSTSYQKPK